MGFYGTRFFTDKELNEAANRVASAANIHLGKEEWDGGDLLWTQSVVDIKALRKAVRLGRRSIRRNSDESRDFESAVQVLTAHNHRQEHTLKRLSRFDSFGLPGL